MIKDLDMKRQMILDSPDGLKDISRIFYWLCFPPTGSGSPVHGFSAPGLPGSPTECTLGSDVPYAVVELWQQHHIFQSPLDRKVCICLKQKVEMTPSLDRNMEEMTFPTKHYLTSPHKIFNCFTPSFEQVILGYSDRSWAF